MKLSSLMVFIALCYSCKTVDLRTEYMDDQSSLAGEERGRKILAESAKKMGYDKMAGIDVYETTANFDWKGLWPIMPMNSLPGNLRKDIQFRFATNSFDGQVEYLEGRKKGLIQGLQSWEGYKITSNDDLQRDKRERYL